MQVTVEQLQDYANSIGARNAKDSLLEAIAEKWDSTIADAGIADSYEKGCHYLSQIAHETGGFAHLEEIHDGSNYEGRSDLGNTQPGDGRRFKGRGPPMLTGRSNYKEAGNAIGVNLIARPELAADPKIGVDISVWYWQSRNINKAADGDHPENVQQVTRLINGGLNGYTNRLAYYRFARRIWRDGMEVQKQMGKETFKDFMQHALTAAGILLISLGVVDDMAAWESIMGGIMTASGAVWSLWERLTK